jgi:hypothetical protein
MDTSAKRPPHKRRSIVRRVVLVAALCPILLTACGSITSSAKTGTRRGGAERTTVATTPSGSREQHQSEADKQVLSAWLAAEEAFHEAVLTADPDEPDLAATTLEPQLGVRLAFLEGMRASDEIARGSTDYGSPNVMAMAGSQATVRSCVDDAEIVISLASSRPVAGELGQVDNNEVTSEMGLTPSGWKLITQHVVVGKCNRR